jgi:hypothetical protein
MRTDAESESERNQNGTTVPQSNKTETQKTLEKSPIINSINNQNMWHIIKSWLTPLSAFITSIVAVYAILHQVQVEERNRNEDHKKWESDYATQVKLAETNRQRDFAIWQKQLAEQHTNWITERNIEWAKQQEIWKQQRAEDWTQQISSMVEQQKKHKSSEKEKLYEDCVYEWTKMLGLMSMESREAWNLNCLKVGLEVQVSQVTGSAEEGFFLTLFKDQVILNENTLRKDIADLYQSEVEVDRLMQSVKFAFAPELQTDINRALLELSKLKVEMPASPEIDNLIETTYRTDTNAWYTLKEYYTTNVSKYIKSEKLESSLQSIDEMMYREIVLEREGAEISAYNLTNEGPIVLKSGKAVHFKNDAPERYRFRIAIDTNRPPEL